MNRFRIRKTKESNNLNSPPPTILLLNACTYFGRGMFSSTVRRAASSAPPSSIVSSLTNATPRAIVSQALPYCCHQRRFSSSKPSSPADGSRGIADQPTVSAAPAKGGAKKSAASKGKLAGEQKSSEQSKKKAKDVAAKATVKGRDASMLHLPSVPNTQHVAPSRKCIETLPGL